MQTLKLYIQGRPKPKQSARFRAITIKDKTIVQSYQTKAVKQQEHDFKWLIRKQLPNGWTPHDGPVLVTSVKYVFPPVTSMTAGDRKLISLGVEIPKTTAPDLTDNLAKGLFDAMEGIVYTNDSRIFEVRNSSKVMGRIPGIEIALVLFDSVAEVMYSSEIEMINPDIFKPFPT